MSNLSTTANYRVMETALGVLIIRTEPSSHELVWENHRTVKSAQRRADALNAIGR